jgi:hypothetical protein
MSKLKHQVQNVVVVSCCYTIYTRCCLRTAATAYDITTPTKDQGREKVRKNVNIASFMARVHVCMLYVRI